MYYFYSLEDEEFLTLINFIEIIYCLLKLVLIKQLLINVKYTN